MKNTGLAKHIVASSLALSLAGCMTNAPEGAPEATAESEPVASIESEIIGVGVTCETAAHDASFTYAGTPNGVTSPDASYDHTGCRHSYIIDGTYQTSGTIAVAYSGPQLVDDSVFPCNSEWVTVKILAVPSRAVIWNPPMQQGTTNGTNPFTGKHFCVGPTLWTTLNRGSYRILTTAGFINSAYEPVHAAWGLHF